jgi:hypothetical protein
MEKVQKNSVNPVQAVVFHSSSECFEWLNNFQLLKETMHHVVSFAVIYT